ALDHLLLAPLGGLLRELVLLEFLEGGLDLAARLVDLAGQLGQRAKQLLTTLAGRRGEGGVGIGSLRRARRRVALPLQLGLQVRETALQLVTQALEADQRPSPLVERPAMHADQVRQRAQSVAPASAPPPVGVAPSAGQGTPRIVARSA